ncbi:MAG: type II toxin-antitoxin system RelE/ParE family toxin [Caenispirillum bisanense]|nr:type II toxin-antitoxin system RelE/ParE family toxin [Caenispirillum bisanense]MCA1973218.1 type II toxin-antitoxin system RelE/ParE family toxin [Caenispirillum sp.]
MAADHFLRAAPDNLAPRALRDYVAILRDSAFRFGPAVARQSRDRLNARISAIADGRVVGHQRLDVRTKRPLRFFNEPPWVIAFDPDTRLVLRILHEKRDFPTLLR